VSTAGAAPFLDRSVHYDRLSAEAVRQLEALAREVAQGALLRVNSAALTLLGAEGPGEGNPPSQAAHRINFGVYVYVDNELPSPEGDP
jgi:hypothetical protein